MLELRALTRGAIIGILTYRVVENRYVPSDKGPRRMDTQERRDSISGRDQTRLSVAWVPVDT